MVGRSRPCHQSCHLSLSLLLELKGGRIVQRQPCSQPPHILPAARAWAPDLQAPSSFPCCRQDKPHCCRTEILQHDTNQEGSGASQKHTVHHRTMSQKLVFSVLFQEPKDQLMCASVLFLLPYPTHSVLCGSGYMGSDVPGR